MKIRNHEQLVQKTRTPELRKLRDDALMILEEALDAVDPKKAILEKVQSTELGFRIDHLYLPWSDIGDVIVVGGGKAAGSMAEAIEEVLGERLRGGVLNVLRGTENRYSLKRIKLNPASHPIPDEAGVRGVNAMMQMASGLNKSDLVICLISGGGSSLMPLPAEGVDLKDIQSTTNLLLKAGATINELNAVRKHLSAIKGGQLARACQPARVVSLILSDVVGDPLDTIASGPTSPDPTTYGEAVTLLEKYGVWDSLSSSIKSRLDSGRRGDIPETPKVDDPIFSNVTNFVVGSNYMASRRATAGIEKRGYKGLLLTTRLEGEARHAGVFIAGLARSLSIDGRPLDPPAGLVLGGETTVNVKGPGKGGRNQELALSAAKKISNLNCVIATLGTDGIDGPTDAAGALVDGETALRAEERGLDMDAILDDNDSYAFFQMMGDHIFTGPTGTNVNDITLVLCGKMIDAK